MGGVSVAAGLSPTAACERRCPRAAPHWRAARRLPLAGRAVGADGAATLGQRTHTRIAAGEHVREGPVVLRRPTAASCEACPFVGPAGAPVPHPAARVLFVAVRRVVAWRARLAARPPSAAATRGSRPRPPRRRRRARRREFGRAAPRVAPALARAARRRRRRARGTGGLDVGFRAARRALRLLADRRGLARGGRDRCALPRAVAAGARRAASDDGAPAACCLLPRRTLGGAPRPPSHRAMHSHAAWRRGAASRCAALPGGSRRALALVPGRAAGQAAGAHAHRRLRRGGARAGRLGA